ncbi:DNA polymerase III subunit delta [Streptococcus danieliae]|nr:DNA polymerase III subunit delta [Streptococcus danieliae]
MIAIRQVEKMTAADFPVITVVAGEDVGQFSLLKEEVLRKIGFDPADLSMSRLDMREVTYAQVQEELESLPFFADSKWVVLDSFLDLTTGRKRYLSDEDLKRFEDYVQNPSPTTKVIIFAEGKLDGKRRLVKLLKRQSHLLETQELKEKDFRTFLQEELQVRSWQLGTDLQDVLLEKSMLNISLLRQNLAFIENYGSPASLTLEELRQLLPKTLQDNLFDLTHYLLQGRLEAARSLMADLRLQGKDDIQILALLLSHFRLFLYVRFLSPLTEANLVAELKRLTGTSYNPYRVRFAQRDSQNLPIIYLRTIYQKIIQTDYEMKTGLYDKAYLMDLLMIEMVQGLKQKN